MAKKVLIVDDDPNTVKFLSVALEQSGYVAVGAYDGREGFQKVEEERPDLVILDVMMPKRTGFTLFKMLKRDDRFTEIPVIMLTGVSQSLFELDRKKGDGPEQPYDSLREALRRQIIELRDQGQERPEHFIEKPIEPERAVESVRRLIGD